MNVSCDPNISHLTSPLLQDYSTMHNVVRATQIGSPWTLAQSSLTGATRLAFVLGGKSSQ